MTLEIDVLTLFPSMVDGAARREHPGRIQEQGLAVIRVHDLRTWGLGRHRSVDDSPYGGGAGMVLRPEPVAAALDAAPPARLDGHPARSGRRGLPPGPGRRLALGRTSCSSARATRASTSGSAALVDLELSIGDYVLTGGELAALVVIDAVLRLLPGAIDEASTAEESFAAGLLEYPQYTRPAVRSRDGRARRPRPATTSRSDAGVASRETAHRRAASDLLAERAATRRAGPTDALSAESLAGAAD